MYTVNAPKMTSSTDRTPPRTVRARYRPQAAAITLWSGRGAPSRDAVGSRSHRRITGRACMHARLRSQSASQRSQRAEGPSPSCICCADGGFGMTPWCDDLVCSWRRLLADRHSLPFPWTLSLHRHWGGGGGQAVKKHGNGRCDPRQPSNWLAATFPTLSALSPISLKMLTLNGSATWGPQLSTDLCQSQRLNGVP